MFNILLNVPGINYCLLFRDEGWLMNMEEQVPELHLLLKETGIRCKLHFQSQS